MISLAAGNISVSFGKRLQSHCTVKYFLFAFWEVYVPEKIGSGYYPQQILNPSDQGYSEQNRLIDAQAESLEQKYHAYINILFAKALQRSRGKKKKKNNITMGESRDSKIWDDQIIEKDWVVFLIQSGNFQGIEAPDFSDPDP